MAAAPGSPENFTPLADEECKLLARAASKALAKWEPSDERTRRVVARALLWAFRHGVQDFNALVAVGRQAVALIDVETPPRGTAA
jgi:hypothetical protein